MTQDVKSPNESGFHWVEIGGAFEPLVTIAWYEKSLDSFYVALPNSRPVWYDPWELVSVDLAPIKHPNNTEVNLNQQS